MNKNKQDKQLSNFKTDKRKINKINSQDLSPKKLIISEKKDSIWMFFWRIWKFLELTHRRMLFHFNFWLCGIGYHSTEIKKVFFKLEHPIRFKYSDLVASSTRAKKQWIQNGPIIFFWFKVWFNEFWKIKSPFFK